MGDRELDGVEEEDGGESVLNRVEVTLPDSMEFDVAAFINQRFGSTESSLDSDFDDVSAALRSAIHALDAQLAQMVRADRHGGAKSARDTASAANHLHELREGLKQTQSLTQVTSDALAQATARIHPLETARINLQATSQALRDLHQLSDAIVACESAVELNSLRELSPDGVEIATVVTILKRFENLPARGSLSKLQEFRKRAGFVYEKIGKLCMETIQEFMPCGSELNESQSTKLRAACVAVEQLGLASVTEFVGRFLAARADAFARFFAGSASTGGKIQDRSSSATGGGAEGGLESVEKRCAWIRAELRGMDTRGWNSVFPAHWNVSVRVAEALSKRVRTHVETYLARKSTSGTIDVDLMLLVLQKTIDFESFLDKKLVIVPPPHPSESSSLRESTGEVSIQTESPVNKPLVSASESVKTESESKKFRGVISTAFEPHLDAYVRMEERSLNDSFLRAAEEETWVIDSTRSAVLSSSMELFLLVKKSFRRCSQLTTHKTMFEMYKVYRKLLQKYATVLSDAIKKRPNSQLLRKSALQRAEFKKEHPLKFSDSEREPGVLINLEVSSNLMAAGQSGDSNRNIRSEDSKSDSTHSSVGEFEIRWELESTVLTAITTTAEYCANTVDQLGDSIRKQIDASFNSEVSMSDIHEQFVAVASRGVRYLVRLIGELHVDPELNRMAGNDWHSKAAPASSSSEYAINLSRVLQSIVFEKSTELSKPYFRFFTERMCISVAPRYLNAVFKSRRVSDNGAQQLLLDISLIKSIFLMLPNLVHNPSVQSNSTMPSASPSSLSTNAMKAAYERLVQKEFGRVEQVLKTLMAPTSVLLDAYIELVPDRTVGELQRILMLRNASTAETNQILEQFAIRSPSLSTDASNGYESNQYSSLNINEDANDVLSVTTASAAAKSISKDSSSSVTRGMPNSGVFNEEIPSMKSLLGRFSGTFSSSNVVATVEHASKSLENAGIGERIKETGIGDRWEQATEKFKGIKF